MVELRLKHISILIMAQSKFRPKSKREPVSRLENWCTQLSNSIQSKLTSPVVQKRKFESSKQQGRILKKNFQHKLQQRVVEHSSFTEC